MFNSLCLDKKYSTTRVLVQEKQKLINNRNDKFKKVLFFSESEERKVEGGLRAKNYFKKSFDAKPLVSIITVVYNGQKYLAETIQSVINQTYDNVEYIIIDGGSTDGTLDIIKKYENQIDYWVSEGDKGIYDAMNKGVDLASGEWINFMNSGDSFYNKDVIKKIFSNNEFESIDVIYGDHNIIYPYKTRIAKAGNIKDIWKGSPFCHQSSFVTSKINSVNKFNLSNRIVGDFEFFYNLYKQDKVFKYVNIVIANYSTGGLSDVKRITSIVERWKVIEKNSKVNLYYIWIIFKEFIKSLVKKIVK